MIHDTHAHLEMLYQKLGLIPEGRDTEIDLPADLDQILKNFSETYLSNHEWIIHPTVSIQNLELALKLFYPEPKIKFLLGAHPEIVDQDFDFSSYCSYLDNKIKDLEVLFPERLIGIGEIGLDYFYTQDQEIIQKQKLLFRYHIELALRLNLPIEIHTRDAWDDTFEILDEYPEIHGKFLIHCFTGNVENLRKCVDRGGRAAFGGIVTFNKSTELQESAVFCPLESMVLETDLPFLAPTPNRGKLCLPEMIEDTAIKMAELKNTAPEIIWEWSRRNSVELFGI
jgi:TatD DNase family protein